MDIQLVIRAQQGNEDAFAALTLAVGDRMHRVAYGILRDPHLAEDATQQALVKVWRKLPRLRDPARFEAWCYRFVVRACYDEARGRSRSLPKLLNGQEPITQDALGVVNDRDQLERGFQRLSVDQRAVVVLHHYLGMTVEDIAQTLDVPVGTVGSRLGRAMEKLRLALHADAPTARPAPQEVSR